MNPHPRDPKWKAVPVMEDEVLIALRRQTWMTVAEVARRLRLLRIVYRTQIAVLLRKAAARGTVERRIRKRTDRGRGPLEYRRAA